MSIFEEKTLSETKAFDGKFLQVSKYDVELSTGRKGIRVFYVNP